MKTYRLFLILMILFVCCLANAASDRFIVTEPATGEFVAKDQISGLFWQKASASNLNWQQAIAYCQKLQHGNFSDWRLPNKIEMLSLINYKIETPATDFPDIVTQSYWSSTTYAGNISTAWVVDIIDGTVTSEFKTTATYGAMCVRSLVQEK